MSGQRRNQRTGYDLQEEIAEMYMREGVTGLSNFKPLKSGSFGDLMYDDGRIDDPDKAHELAFGENALRDSLKTDYLRSLMEKSEDLGLFESSEDSGRTTLRDLGMHITRITKNPGFSYGQA